MSTGKITFVHEDEVEKLPEEKKMKKSKNTKNAERPRWQFTTGIIFLTGENITTPTVSKGKKFTPRGITSH